MIRENKFLQFYWESQNPWDGDEGLWRKRASKEEVYCIQRDSNYTRRWRVHRWRRRRRIWHASKKSWQDVLQGRKVSNFCRTRLQGKNKRRKQETGPCYHFKKIGHLIADCSSIQATISRRSQKKAAMVATWEDWESDSDVKVDTTNIYFMTHGDDPTKVSLKTSPDDDELTWMSWLHFSRNYKNAMRFWKFKTKS